jgi:carboxyl-terminal processing protease
MIRVTEEMTARKTLSLNKEARKAQLEKDLARSLERENERRMALGLEPVASMEDIDADDFPDILLDQAADIVTDLATMRELDGPPQTARIQR